MFKSPGFSNRIMSNACAFMLASAVLAAPSSQCFAADGVSMAPPISVSNQATSGSSSVFKWSEIPTDQKVPLSRETFDQSGYQLYDTANETILVPFTDNNLYVMKFALSPDGTTYLVNRGAYPVLYIPRDGYLINQAANGARWYPFTNGFAPDHPVFLGVAANWDDFCGMGWYPGMIYRGGYWCDGHSFSVAALVPCAGFLISIGVNTFSGWGPYHNYYVGNPAPYHIGFAPHDWRHWSPPQGGVMEFRGGVDAAPHGIGWTNHQHFGGGSDGGPGNGRVFRGAIGFGARESAPRGSWHDGVSSGNGRIHDFHGVSDGGGYSHGGGIDHGNGYDGGGFGGGHQH